MKSDQLPRHVGMIILVTLVTLMAGLGWLFIAFASEMDRKEARNSARLVGVQVADLARALSDTAADYNIWTEAYLALQEPDVPWLAENYASTTSHGTSFNAVVFTGGPLDEDLIWRDGERVAKAALPAELQTHFVEMTLALGMTAPRPLTVFFRKGEGLAMASAIRVRPHPTSGLVVTDPSEAPLAVLIRRVTPADLAEIARRAGVADLRFAIQPEPGQANLPLMSAGGQSPGYLVWTPPNPGADGLQQVTPWLVIGAVSALALVVALAQLANRQFNRAVASQVEARQKARADSLTGLANRLALSGWLQELDDQPLVPAAMILMDINDLKQVNDRLGHTAGDRLLSGIAGRLSSFGSTWDGKTGWRLARIGGDEFVLFGIGPDCQGDLALTRAAAVSQALKPPHALGSERLVATAAIGLALREPQDISAKELLRRAEAAMYRAKRDRYLSLHAWTPELDGHSREDRDIADSLRADLQRPGAFSLVYQPIIGANDGKLVKAEALLRWHPEGFTAPTPDRFIAVAEQAGLMPSLGLLILDLACADLVAAPELRISLNVSPMQVQDPNFIEILSDRLMQHGIHPSRIEMELTEGVLIDNPAAISSVLDGMRLSGLGLALDDFGTGFSSIGYLRRMPFDTLKIDRSMLAPQPQTGAPNVDLLRSIILLGHSLGKIMVCEGVESEADANLLCGLGCDLLQGYHIGRPMPLSDLLRRYSLEGRNAA